MTDAPTAVDAGADHGRDAPVDGEDAVTAAEPGGGRRFRPASIHRIGQLPDRERWAVIAGLALFGALPLLSAAIVLHQGWIPIGDNALIGLRIRDVLDGNLPLTGQPTTGENFGSGIPTSHPGPIEFYLLAPLVAVLGPTVGVALGAGAINSAAFVAIGWLSFRRGGTPLMALSVLATLAMSRSLGGNLLHDPVSSNVGTMASFALLYSAWCLIAGDLRTIPVFVAIGTFTLQDHLAYLGTGTPLVLATIGIGIAWIVRARRAGVGDWLRRTLANSVGIGLVLWLPVLWDEVFGNQNVNAIFRTFTGKRTPGEGTAFALERVAEALAPVPLFARRIDVLGYLHTPNGWELAMGYAVLVAIVALGVRAVVVRRTDLAAMVLVTLVALASGCYAAVKLPVGAGVQASNLHWMWVVGAFSWVALAWMAWDVLPQFWRDVLRPGVAFAIVVAMVAATVGTVSSIDLATDRDGSMALDTAEIIDELRAELPEGTYRVTYEGGSAVVSLGPAVIYDLANRGDRLLMDVGPFTRAYGAGRAYDGQPTDGHLVITSDAVAPPTADAEVLVRHPVTVNRKDGERKMIRIYLIEDTRG